MGPTEATPLPEDELEATWRALLGRKGQLKSDRTLAELAIELIRELGNGTPHREVLRELAEGWPEDWKTTLAIAALLIEQAARRGMDEPVVSEDTPARWASDALRRALDALDHSERRDPAIAGHLHASLGNALRLCGPGRDADAQQAFNRALELDGERGSWWYDLGLLHKWRGRFEEGLRANQMALDHKAARRPALWNLAICATGLGSGEVARRSWEELGMPAQADPKTKMPLVDGLPPLLVRVLSRPSPVDATTKLPTGVGFELVWVAPLSPCHGVVQSPTFRDAPIDYGDLVLWDGAPVAEHRISDCGPVPVFPLLEILRHGDERRWPFAAIEKEKGALVGLEQALPDGTRVFVQQERLEHHCAACEAGVAHEHGSVSEFARGKIIVPAAVELASFRDAWEASVGSGALAASLPSLYEELGETKRAGQEHQAWRGIERKALRRKADR
ncbi:MAG: tetratricopeptide repeat protein [Myxococcales bacterium]|nr:tetratricopeptide repeat protein [Myxococcales bacterium]MDH3485173.1 tetratricopeptide repeat protein [Myxococcales bacterium]